MSKYAVAVDHNASSGKGWTFIKLENTDKAMAFAEGTIKGFTRDQVFCVIIIKKIRKNKWQCIARIYPNGKVEDISGESYSEWNLDEKWDFEN